MISFCQGVLLNELRPDSDPEVRVISALATPLRDHQVEAVKFMVAIRIVFVPNRVLQSYVCSFFSIAIKVAEHCWFCRRAEERMRGATRG